jgi:hypothetical protein
MDNLAPARLFPKQAFTCIPDTMTPPTPELFLIFAKINPSPILPNK